MQTIGFNRMSSCTRSKTQGQSQNQITTMANSERLSEIEEDGETAPLLQESNVTESDPSPRSTQSGVQTKVPEAEVHVYKQGKGPIEVLKIALGGWEQDQLEVREILEKYGFKSVYAFAPESGRGVPIRFNQRNGRSLLTYKDGAVIYLDGEPKDSLLQPITKILLGVAVTTFLIIVVMKETPEWGKKFNLSIGGIPPWVLACAVIVFTRMSKRTRSFLERRLH